MSSFDFEKAFSGLFRESYGRITATLAREFRDLELIEDAVQEALEAAAFHWARVDLPDNPAGWLYVVARRKAIDALRRESRRKRRVIDIAREARHSEERINPMVGMHASRDERLSLMFACCHPVINEPAQVALTLQTLSALSTAEIAAAFLTKESTVAQRIVRAKRKIRDAGIPFSIPDVTEAPQRLASVLSAIYLIFNAGYTAHSGTGLLKTDLCDEGIFLARILTEQMPEQPEVLGLLALLLFQDSRRAARTASDGSPILLKDQDRTLWDREKIAEALELLALARAHTRVGLYQTQAEIAALHASSARAADTPWDRILTQYDVLLDIHPSPVVFLNRAVALRYAHGPEAALRSLEEVDLQEHLRNYHYYHATRGEFLMDLGHYQEARDAFERALELAGNEQERAHLERRINVTRAK